MDKQAKDDNMFVYVGTYKDEDSAESDYDGLLNLHKEGWVGSYDVGIVARDDAGKLDIKRHTDSTGKGTRRGLALGVLLGAIFPPSILASGVIGAGAGAAIGHQYNDISKDDLRDIGALMENNEAALVVVGESKLEEVVDQAEKAALKEYKREFKADSKEFDKQLNLAIKAM